jgi:hypothetical protein
MSWADDFIDRLCGNTTLGPIDDEERRELIEDIDYYEYDCGSPCTTNGCPGHGTDIPIGLLIAGVWFWADEGFLADKEQIERVRKAVEELDKLGR